MSEDIFASLAGGQHFTTLGLSQAYQHLVVDDASKELVTINTQQGLYIGIGASPAGTVLAGPLIQRANKIHCHYSFFCKWIFNQYICDTGL